MKKEIKNALYEIRYIIASILFVGGIIASIIGFVAPFVYVFMIGVSLITILKATLIWFVVELVSCTLIAVGYIWICLENEFKERSENNEKEVL